MNKSCEYIAMRRNVPIDEMDLLSEDPMETMNMPKENIVFDLEDRKIHLDFHRDTKESPNFYSYKSLQCDGTFAFFLNLFDEMRKDYLSNIHYNIELQKDIITDFISGNKTDLYVHYFYGDLIGRISTCEGTEEKPWMRDRFELFWPMRTELELK